MHSVLQRELPATAPDFQATARLFGCVPLTCWSISEDRHVSGSRFVPLFTPSLQWVPWPPHLPWPCGSPPSSVLWDRTIPPNPSSAVSGCPRPPTTSSANLAARRLGGFPKFLENPYESVPRARDSGGSWQPRLTVTRMLPSVISRTSASATT